MATLFLLNSSDFTPSGCDCCWTTLFACKVGGQKSFAALKTSTNISWRKIFCYINWTFGLVKGCIRNNPSMTLSMHFVGLHLPYIFFPKCQNLFMFFKNQKCQVIFHICVLQLSYSIHSLVWFITCHVLAVSIHYRFFSQFSPHILQMSIWRLLRAMHLIKTWILVFFF